MDVTFLIGAGVSVAVGMPCTRQITEAVLTSDDFVRLPDGRVHFDRDSRLPTGPPLNQRDQARTRVVLWQRFLRSVRDHMKALLSDSEPTYEQLYYVADALWRDLARVERDPFAEAFWRSLEPGLPADLSAAIGQIRSIGACLDLNPESYIRGAVAAYLHHHELGVADTSSLSLFGDAAGDPDTRRIHVFTLNHDTLIERYLDSRGVTYFDGLAAPDGGRRWLEPDAYCRERAERVIVIKLHGSKNWGCYQDQQTGRFRHGVQTDPYPQDSSWTLQDCHPRLLVGTANKARLYLDSPFPQLFCHFYSHLERTKSLIVCGHSFGDEGIRAYLTNWVAYGAAQRLCIIDPNASELKRLWMLRSVPQNEARILAVDHGIEDVSWREVKAWLSA